MVSMVTGLESPRMLFLHQEGGGGDLRSLQKAGETETKTCRPDLVNRYLFKTTQCGKASVLLPKIWY